MKTCGRPLVSYGQSSNAKSHWLAVKWPSLKSPNCADDILYRYVMLLYFNLIVCLVLLPAAAAKVLNLLMGRFWGFSTRKGALLMDYSATLPVPVSEFVNKIADGKWTDFFWIRHSLVNLSSKLLTGLVCLKCSVKRAGQLISSVDARRDKFE